MENKLKDWVIPAIVGVTSFGAGVGVGYLLCKIRVNQQPEVIVEAEEPEDPEEDPEDKQYQLDFVNAERDRALNRQIMELQGIISELKGVDPKEEFKKKAAAITVVPNDIRKSIETHPSSNEGEVVAIHQEDILVTSIFEDDEDEWDYDYEIAHREPPKPYVIHRDEYDENEFDHRQCSLMYYAGDNILVDDQDVPVYNADKVVGELKFGHGSRDPSICYVRNEKLDSDFEIIIDHGSYQEEVLGEKIEHSLKRAPGKPKFHLE